jgi:hypothetical protein
MSLFDVTHPAGFTFKITHKVWWTRDFREQDVTEDEQVEIDRLFDLFRQDLLNLSHEQAKDLFSAIKRTPFGTLKGEAAQRLFPNVPEGEFSLLAAK